MGATFRGDPKNNPTLTFYSRTTYIGYMGLLDAAIAHVMTHYITDDPSRIRFRWHISSAQLHCFKTLPFIFSQPDLYDKLNHCNRSLRRSAVSFRKRVAPTWYHLTKWYAKILEAFDKHGVDMINHEKYGPYKRIKRRWLEHERHLDKNIPPSVQCTELDFERCISARESL